MLPEGNSEADEKGWAKPAQFGPYYLQELIASGGMADIWLATDPKGQTFSLRRLRNSSLFNFTEKKRFLRGCHVLSQIHHHESVIGYAGHGKISGSYYLLMEYVEASNLKQLFARDDPVLAENVGNILIDMALALEHVHDSGFMHLDFKPENVLVTRNASVRLVDFDLAQPKPDRPKKSADNPGTPGYMAPEQLQRQPFDHRVDIFAFGVSAYEILTGRKPLSAKHRTKFFAKQLARSSNFFHSGI